MSSSLSRPSSPSHSEVSASSGSSLFSRGSNSSQSSSSSLVYSRDELLMIGMSPLSHVAPPSALTTLAATIPEIMRKTRRGPVEAQRALEYSTSYESGYSSPSPPSSPTSRHRRNNRHGRKHNNSNNTNVNANAANKPEKHQAQEVPHPKPALVQETAVAHPPVLKVGVYIPPARRMAATSEQQQRERTLPNRSVRQPRTWRRPAQMQIRPILVAEMVGGL